MIKTIFMKLIEKMKVKLNYFVMKNNRQRDS